MPCPEQPSRNRRRFAFTLVPPDPGLLEREEARQGRTVPCPDLPCACEQCHLYAVAPFEYTPGCRCDACRVTHAALMTLRDAHAPAGRCALYTVAASQWPDGSTSRLYAKAGKP